MAFNDQIRSRVRKAAAFRCCLCERYGPLEIHHIVPQAQGGPDTFENAAPLCPRCHVIFGGNDMMRRQIVEKRDLWYEVVPHRYPLGIDKLEECADALEQVESRSTASMDRTKQAVVAYLAEVLERIDPSNAVESINLIVDSIPLDSGVLVPPEMIAYRGLCRCERTRCVGHPGKVYCYFESTLNEWVIESRLYYRCYDEIIECSRCGTEHKRGHVGAPWACPRPFSEEELYERKRALRAEDAFLRSARGEL